MNSINKNWVVISLSKNQNHNQNAQLNDNKETTDAPSRALYCNNKTNNKLLIIPMIYILLHGRQLFLCAHSCGTAHIAYNGNNALQQICKNNTHIFSFIGRELN